MGGSSCSGLDEEGFCCSLGARERKRLERVQSRLLLDLQGYFAHIRDEIL